MIIQNAKLRGKEGLWHIVVRDGKFEQITQTLETTTNDEVMDVNGALVLPPFIEPHIHLDTTLTAGEPEWNLSGTLFEGIQRWSERKAFLTHEDVKTRSKTALKWQMAQGIQHVRTHVDVTDPSLTAVKAMLEVKEEMAPYIDIQLVAFSAGRHSLLSERRGIAGGIPENGRRRGRRHSALRIYARIRRRFDEGCV